MTTNTKIGKEMLGLSSKLGAIQLNPFINKYKKQDYKYSSKCNQEGF